MEYEFKYITRGTVEETYAFCTETGCCATQVEALLNMLVGAGMPEGAVIDACESFVRGSFIDELAHVEGEVL